MKDLIINKRMVLQLFWVNALKFDPPDIECYLIPTFSIMRNNHQFYHEHLCRYWGAGITFLFFGIGIKLFVNAKMKCDCGYKNF